MIEELARIGREYLQHVSPDYQEVIDEWDDERVLREVNRIYFGGIQRFAKMYEKKG